MNRRPLNPAAKRPRASITTHTDWYRITPPGVTNGPDADTTTIDIYEAIGGWIGLGADEFVKDLRAVTTPNIELHINSEGGDVWDAIAIYNALLQHPATVNVVIDSLAASAASFIAMAGDRVSAAKNSQVMIHDALGMAIGNAADHREMAGFLDKMSDEIASIYADRTEDDASVWRERMQAETWYNATEAKDAGLVDEVLGRDGKAVENRKLVAFQYRGRNDAPDPVETVPDRPDGDDTTESTTAQAGSRMTELLARTDALLAGRDPDEKADPITVARLTGRLAARADIDELAG